MSSAKTIRVEFDANPKAFSHVPFIFEKMAFYAADFNRKAKEQAGYPIEKIKAKLETEMNAICTSYKRNMETFDYNILHGYGSNHYWISIKHKEDKEPTRIISIIWEDQ